MPPSETPNPISSTKQSITAKLGKSAARPRTKASSKQDTVLAMLRAPTGTTLKAIVKATGWQQHSVRGFLAGIVRKKLKLNLVSEIKGEDRIYRVTRKAAGKSRVASKAR